MLSNGEDIVSLFGLWPTSLDLSPAKKGLTVIAFRSLLVRRLILPDSKTPFTYTTWVRKVLYGLVSKAVSFQIVQNTCISV